MGPWNPFGLPCCPGDKHWPGDIRLSETATTWQLLPLLQPPGSVQQRMNNTLGRTGAAQQPPPHLAQKGYDRCLKGCDHSTWLTLELMRRRKIKPMAHLSLALIDTLLIAPSCTGKAFCTALGQLHQCQEFLTAQPAFMVLPGKLQFQRRIWWLASV